MESNSLQLTPRTWLPSAVTAANFCLGFISMLAAAAGRFDDAVYLLVVAILLDTLDGKVARLLRATSDFGKQLDSFSDLLSSGAAPAFLVYQALLKPLGGIGIATALVFLLAGVFRLARFNILSDSHSKERRTLGLPIPIGAGYLMVLTLMRHEIGPWVAVTVVLIMAWGMISRLRLPGMTGFNLVTACLGVGMLNYLAIVFLPNWYTVGWWTLWNIVILIAARAQDRRLTPTYSS